MRDIAERWYGHVRVGNLTRYNAWMAFHIYVTKTLEYLPLALTLMEAGCNLLTTLILREGLPNIGIC